MLPANERLALEPSLEKSEGRQMRREIAILAVALSTLTACTGGAAQEPLTDAVVPPHAAKAPAPSPQAPAAEAEPIAAEVDVPFTIALLSSAKTAGGRSGGRVIVGDREPELGVTGLHERVRDDAVDDTHFHVAIDVVDETPAPAKSCSGVVNRRS